MERDRKVMRLAMVRRTAQELDGDEPAASAAARRYASMDEEDREEVRVFRCAFVAMDRACGTSRKTAPGRLISFRLEGGKLVRRQAEEEVPASGGGGGVVGESSPSVAAAGSEDDDLCSAFGSARV